MLALQLGTCNAAAIGSGGFNPAVLFAGSVNGVWLDPSDKSTMFQSGTRAAPGAAVVNDGDPVGLILDKSGNANDFVQATTTKRPLFKTSGGLSWLQFDGVSQCMASAAAIGFNTYAQIGCALAIKPSSTALGIIVEHGPDANSTAGGFIFDTGDPSAGHLAVAANGGSINGATTTGATFGSGVVSVETVQSFDITQSTTARAPIRINGVAVSLTAVGGAGSAANFSSQVMNLGARGGSSLFYAGNIYGALFRGGAFSASELAKVETFEGAKVGQTL